jgi:uncharacterized Zn finger protein
MDGMKENPLANINLAEVPYMECESCKCKTFEERMMIKKVSRFMTGSDQDSIVPLQVIACAQCGNVNELFLPKV